MSEIWERIFENDEIIIDKAYDVYRISFFKDYHFVDDLYYNFRDEAQFFGGIFDEY